VTGNSQSVVFDILGRSAEFYSISAGAGKLLRVISLLLTGQTSEVALYIWRNNGTGEVLDGAMPAVLSAGCSI
jgi:hypothetical protein